MSERIAKLKAARTGVIDKMKSLMDKATSENRDLSEAEVKEYDGHKAEVARLKGLIDREAEVMGLDAEVIEVPEPKTKAAPAKVKVADPEPEDESESDPAADRVKAADRFRLPKRKSFFGDVVSAPKDGGLDAKWTFKMAVAIKALKAAKDLPHMSVLQHMDELGFGQLADQFFQAQTKALNTGTASEGGVFMPNELINDFIDFLRPRTWLFRAGPVPISLSNGAIRINGGNVGATASYRAEGASVAYTEATFQEMSLSPKQLGAVTSLTNELISRSPQAIESIVRTDLSNAFGQTMDLAAMRGDGTSNTPTGIRNLLNAANVIVDAGATTATIDEIDLLCAAMEERMDSQHIPPVDRVYLMNTQLIGWLRTLRTSLGVKVYPSLEGENPTFQGRRVIVSNQVPGNLEATTDATELYLIDMGYVWYGDAENMQMLISNEASFTQGGVLVSAFDKNLTAIRLTGAHDFAMRYDRAAAVATNIRWGR